MNDSHMKDEEAACQQDVRQTSICISGSSGKRRRRLFEWEEEERKRNDIICSLLARRSLFITTDPQKFRGKCKRRRGKKKNNMGDVGNEKGRKGSHVQSDSELFYLNDLVGCIDFALEEYGEKNDGWVLLELLCLLT